MKIYVINLERDYPRRAQMAAQLARLGWEDADIIRAVDGSALPDSLIKQPVYNRQWLNSMRGTIGCFLSHLSAWEKIANSPDEFGIVLEDDVTLRDLSFLRIMEIPPQAGVVFLNDRLSLDPAGDGSDNQLQPIRAVLPRLENEKLAGGGDGYLLRREAAQRLIAAVEADGIYGHVDGRLLRYATADEDLQTLPADSWIVDVIRHHHNPERPPALGVIQGYVLRHPLVVHQPQDSTRETADGVFSLRQAAPVSLRLREPADKSGRAPALAENAVPIRYWNRIRNVGDSANPDIIAQVSQLKPSFCFNDKAPHVLGIGSVLFMATPASVIWGSGVLDPRHPLAAIPPSQVRALRGQLSLQHLQQHLGVGGDVALGDPGMLVTDLPEIKALQSSTTKRYRYAVIPHHDMFHNEYFQTIARSGDALLLDVRLGLNDFIAGLLSAEIVVSQSLHGLIFAEALGLPHVWISHTQDEVWQFKFRDWFSTTQSPERKPLSLGLPLEKLRSEARLSGSTIDREALRAAFPRELQRPRSSTYDFRETRQLSPLLVFVEGMASASDFPFRARAMRVSLGNEEALRKQLNQISRDFDEAFETILVFDSELFGVMKMDVINSAIRLLDRQVDKHYVQLVSRALIESSEGPFQFQEGLQLSVNDSRLHRWRGVVIARHGVNFSFDAPSILAFV